MGITAAVSPGNNGEQVGAVGCAIEVWDDGGLAPLAPEAIDDGYGSITVLGVAKNPIAVGGRRKSSPPGITTYSGRGPTRDGRLKPDIVAVSGDEESLLAMPSTPQAYDSDLGVSYATPQVAGAAALLLEHYRRGDPSFVQHPAVLKAVLANTAIDVGAPGPDYSNGYGRIDLPRALTAVDSYLTVVLDQGDVETLSLGADVSNACGLRVMAAWSDPPSMGASPTQLVNDIDLSVFSDDSEMLPWVLTPSNPLNIATRGVNSLDNVEQVTVDAPTGNELVRLVGTNVQLGPQEVTVHWFVVPCDDAGGTGTSGGDETGVPGCACVSAQEHASPLWYSWLLILSLARSRARRNEWSGSSITTPGHENGSG